MKFDISSSHNYEKDFFGRAYPWYRGFLLSINNKGDRHGVILPPYIYDAASRRLIYNSRNVTIK